MTDDEDKDYAHLYHRPAERYGQVQEETRIWFENLRSEDIIELKEALKFYRTARSVGRFNKYLIGTGMSAFVLFVAFGEKMHEAWSWIVGKP